MILDVFSKEYLDTMISDASDSVRKRKHRNTHYSFDENCQQLINAIGVESYIAPNRHLLEPKSECLIAVRGLFAAVIFLDTRTVEQIEFFEQKNLRI